MKKAVLFVLLFILNSCSDIIPAKFWADFRSDLIIYKKSDQGPFGGTAEIVWNFKDNNLKTDEIFIFAKENGWDLKDSLAVHNLKLKNSEEYLISEIIEQENLINVDFSNAKIYIFKTGLLRFKPGKDNSTQNNGLVILSNDKTKMKVFNIWGE